MHSVYHALCTLGVLLVIANAFAIMFTGKFSLFGLDRLAGMVAGGLVTGIGRLAGRTLLAIGRMIEDGLRIIFCLPPRQRPRQRQQNNEE